MFMYSILFSVVPLVHSIHFSQILKWSVFSCVKGWNEGEGPKGRKGRSGNYFSHYYFSLKTITLLNSILVVSNIWYHCVKNTSHFLCNINKSSTNTGFGKSNWTSPAVQMQSLMLSLYSEVKHWINWCTIIVWTSKQQMHLLEANILQRPLMQLLIKHQNCLLHEQQK